MLFEINESKNIFIFSNNKLGKVGKLYFINILIL